MVRAHPDPPERGWAWGARSADGGVAQLGEHLLCKQGVIGSIPFTSTSNGGQRGGQAAGGRQESRAQGTVGVTVRYVLVFLIRSSIGCSLTIWKK